MAQSVMMPSFSGGELSTNLYARVDLDKYHTGVATLRNFFVDYRGGVANRAGTKYIATCPTGIVRLISFIVSRDQSYILLFSDLQILVYLRGTLVATVVSPYGEDDIFQLRYVQSADVLTLSHPSYPVYNLNRTSATAFALVKETYGAGISPPNNPTCVATVSSTAMYYSYCVTAINAHGEESLASTPSNVGSKALDPTAATPVTISLSWNSVSGAKVYNVYKAGPTPAGSAMPTVLGYIGQSKITDFVDNNIGPDFSQVPPDYRDPFSPGQITDVTLTAGGAGASGDYISVTISGDGSGASVFAVTASGVAKGAVISRGGIDYTTATATPASGSSTYTVTLDPNNHYPACVTYFQQRRCFAGADVSPDLIEMSKTGFYSNFDVSPAVLDSDAITINIASREVNNIEHMVPMSTGLVVFTRGNAFLVTGGGQSGAVTPTNIAATPQASTGAGPLPPLVVNYNILFQQYEGTVIRDMAFQWQTSSYFGTDRSMLANHLFFEQTLTDWAFASEPNHLLHVVRGDGKMLAMAYVPEQEVYGWAQWDTQGEFISVASIPEDGQSAVYVVVRRHIPNDDGDPCWINYLERFATREDCCIFEDWFLDSAVTLPSSTDTDYTLYPSGTSGDITITSYDPCISPAVATGPFAGGYIMEAKENYDPTRAAEADGGTFSTVTFADSHLISCGYDITHRELVYQVVICRSGTNDTGHDLWDGLTKIAAGDTYEAANNFNFYLARKNIDTGVVTFYDGYDVANVVPIGIGPGGGGGVSDGTWRRYVSDTSNVWMYPTLNDPRTGDSWVHTESCDLWVFRRTDSYAAAISPLRPVLNVNNAVIPRAATTDWVYATELNRANTAGSGKLYLIPRVDTAAEVTADTKLAYATYALPAFFTSEVRQSYTTALDGADALWFFASPFTGSPDFRLYKFTKPSAFVYPTPPVDGGFTSITPWTSTTGPNTPLAGQTLNNERSMRLAAFFSPGRTQLNLLSIAYANDFAVYDYANVSIYHTYYNINSGVWASAKIASGYMKADFTITADPMEAAFVLTGQTVTNNSYLEADTFYDDADYASRWFFFEAFAISAGVVNTADRRMILVELEWHDGAVPTVVQVIDEADTWDLAYTDYAAAIQVHNPSGSSSRVIAQSMQTYDLHFGMGVDRGIYDPDTNVFWLSGMGNDAGDGNNMFYLDDAFAARATATGPDDTPAQPPLLRLSFSDATVPVAEGDILAIDCGKVTITSVDSAAQLSGTVTTSWDGALDDDAATITPVTSWSITTPVSAVTGLGHLEGKSVYALADGKVVGPRTVASGSISLGFSASSVVAGLQYTSQFKTLRLDVGEPTIQGKRKIIQSLQLRVKCSVGFEVGTTDFSAIYQPKTNYPDFAGGPSAYTAYVQGGAAAIPFSGDVLVNVQAGWERDGVLTVQQSLPLPVTILGLIPEVTVGDNQR